jgi:hypothetical protein
MLMSNTLHTVSNVDRYTLSTLSEQRWLIVFGRSPVIRANSRCERSRSFKISFSLIVIGMAFPFLFSCYFYDTQQIRIGKGVGCIVKAAYNEFILNIAAKRYVNSNLCNGRVKSWTLSGIYESPPKGKQEMDTA